MSGQYEEVRLNCKMCLSWRTSQVAEKWIVGRNSRIEVSFEENRFDEPNDGYEKVEDNRVQLPYTHLGGTIS